MNEEDYTTNVVIPLLRQLGYSEVTYNHGIAEFGKDVVFADYDRFGNKVYHAAQVKVGDLSGSNKSKVNDIISHIERAFDIAFDDLISKTGVRLSHFFVIVSGRFVGNARQAFVGSSRLSTYLHRLHFYEGHQLESLATRAFRELRYLLESQLAELAWNKLISQAVAGLTSTSMVTPYSTSNLTRLIDGVATAERYTDLLRKLRMYQARLLRLNGVIALLPVLLPLNGATNEIAWLKSEALSTEAAADAIVSPLRTAIGELEP
jgi:hypothetical protein